MRICKWRYPQFPPISEFDVPATILAASPGIPATWLLEEQQGLLPVCAQLTCLQGCAVQYLCRKCRMKIKGQRRPKKCIRNKWNKYMKQTSTCNTCILDENNLDIHETKRGFQELSIGCCEPWKWNGAPDLPSFHWCEGGDKTPRPWSRAWHLGKATSIDITCSSLHGLVFYAHIFWEAELCQQMFSSEHYQQPNSYIILPKLATCHYTFWDI